MLTLYVGFLFHVQEPLSQRLVVGNLEGPVDVYLQVGHPPRPSVVDLVRVKNTRAYIILVLHSRLALHLPAV